MTENKTEKSRWAAPLRVLAMVLAAALLSNPGQKTVEKTEEVETEDIWSEVI